RPDGLRGRAPSLRAGAPHPRRRGRPHRPGDRSSGAARGRRSAAGVAPGRQRARRRQQPAHVAQLQRAGVAQLLDRSEKGRELSRRGADTDRADGVDERPLVDAHHRHAGFRSLGLGMIVALILVYLLLMVLFQSALDPLIIMVAVPGAFAGIAWMLALTGTTLNVESFMGAIMAIGIAVSNSILLVSFANQARAEDEGLSASEAALGAAQARLRPVLMTAL